MARRKGMMVGKGKKGYHNVVPKDKVVHSQSAKGIKQPQKVAFPYTREYIGLKPIKTQRRQFLFKYIPSWAKKDRNLKKDFLYFNKLPISKAKQLMTGTPNVNINDTQNESPPMWKMVEIAESYDGTLEGYATEPTRDDARITFEGFTIKVNPRLAKEIADRYKPDEFDRVSKNKYRFWWD